MNARFLVLAAGIALAAAPAAAQQRLAATPPGAAEAMVGGWLHDDRGQIVGSIRSFSPDNRMAVVALGIYLYDRVRLVEVSVDALRLVDGKVTLRRDGR